MISDQLRCIYIHIPKTGGHSIDKFFAKRGLVSRGEWHATASELRAAMGWETYRSYLSFATIRNPWDRFVSEYFWQGSACRSQIPTPWGNKTITFADFCKSDFHWYPEIERTNGHLKDQAHFIYDEANRMLVDRVIRFESLTSEFADLCATLDLPPSPLPRLNATNHLPYWKYYTDELVEIVGYRFHRDISLFGYKFGQ